MINFGVVSLMLQSGIACFNNLSFSECEMISCGHTLSIVLSVFIKHGVDCFTLLPFLYLTLLLQVLLFSCYLFLALALLLFLQSDGVCESTAWSLGAILVGRARGR